MNKECALLAMGLAVAAMPGVASAESDIAVDLTVSYVSKETLNKSHFF